MGHVTLHSIRASAQEMGVPFRQAVFERLRYVRQQLLSLTDELQGVESPVAVHIVTEEILGAAKEQTELVKALKEPKTVGTGITEQQIDQARAYPIERLIQFDRSGKALAWCHPDKRPSLHWHRQANRAHCFPCGKSFDPIAVLMDRDGMSFPTAVRELTRY